MIAATFAPAFDRTATASPALRELCQEIRSRNVYGTGHHWCVDIDNRVYMQSISCAKCGNYQQVSSYPLYTLIQSAKSIVCEDPEHIRITNETILMERGLDLAENFDEDFEEDFDEDFEENRYFEDRDQDSPAMRYSDQFEVRNERLDDWSQEEGNYDWVSDKYFP